jgi:hypothetical protein
VRRQDKGLPSRTPHTLNPKLLLQETAMSNESGLYTALTGTCTNCGANTAAGGFQLCPECAAMQNKCAFCDGPLDAVKPPTPPDARLVYLVSLNHDHKQPGEGREATLVKTGESVDSFKSAIAELLSQQKQPAGSIEILNELRAIGLVAIRCTQSLAAAVGDLSSVNSVLENE